MVISQLVMGVIVIINNDNPSSIVDCHGSIPVISPVDPSRVTVDDGLAASSSRWFDSSASPT